jgi:enoyl-CoA hydratase
MTEFVTCEKINCLGLLTLNRPKKLNALNVEMCAAIDSQLTEWQNDDDVKAIIIRGNGERAFCAGGDIASVYHNGRENFEQSLEFFRLEYQMNKRIFHYNKPYIALMHGVTMGGGLGVSVHGSCRIADPEFVMAMPETAIGFYPDVGGSYFLSRARGELGTYLGLTGARIDAASAHHVGLVDYAVPYDCFDELVAEFIASPLDDISMIDGLVSTFSVQMHAPKLLEYEATINQCFAKNSIEEIFTALKNQNTAWADEVISSLEKKSPTSLRATLKQIRQANGLSFDDCMASELKLTAQMLQSQDFYEGIRAAVIDKDNQPQWAVLR